MRDSIAGRHGVAAALVLALGGQAPGWEARAAAEGPAQAEGPTQVEGAPKVEGAPQGFMRWFDPSTAPFIPIPEIDVDPNSGTTLGLIPTWLITDDQEQIRKIIAPAIDHNPYFGLGVAHEHLFVPVGQQAMVVGRWGRGSASRVNSTSST